MAENIGKVQIAIEAQTAELQQGLAKAEKAVKDSAKKMEQSTEKLADKAEKSWTEFASKMGVVQQIGGIAQQAWNALDGVLDAVTQSGANASQKLTGGLDAIEQAGVPVVSQFLAIGRGIYGWISGEKALQKEIEQRNAQLKRIAEREIKGFNERLALRKALTESTENFLKILSLEAEMSGKATDREKLRLKQQREREALLEQFAEKQQELDGKATKNYLDSERKRFDEAFELFKQKQSRELEAFDNAEIDKADKAILENQRKNDAIEKQNEALAKAEADKAKANAKLKLSLEERLAIMTAKQAGEDEKAQRLAIESRYRKEMEGRTEAQRQLLQQMREIELAGVGAGVAKTSTSATEGVDKAIEKTATATIATAIGGFTVQTGQSKAERETKKQTTLLEVIAENTTQRQGEQLVRVAS